jgi:hypothetical protein
LFNQTLLEKWLWHYATEEALWRSVVEVKYDSMKEGGVLMRFLGPMGLEWGKTLGVGWGISLDL